MDERLLLTTVWRKPHLAELKARAGAQNGTCMLYESDRVECNKKEVFPGKGH